MSIKHHFVRLAEKIHGRKCSRCVFNHGGKCNLNQDAFSECWQSITRPNFSKRNEDLERAGRWVAEGFRKGVESLPGEMTEEELRQLRDTVISLTEACEKAINDELTDEDMYQLEQITASLKEASETARDAGLLCETEPRPIWEDKTESGLLEEE